MEPAIAADPEYEALPPARLGGGGGWRKWRGHVAALAVLLVAAPAVYARVGGSASLRGPSAAGADTIEFVNWHKENKLAPWLSPIKEGASQGVGIVLGQSLKPDGTPSKIIINRAKAGKVLLDEKKVVALIVSGGDPAGVGKTEAFEMKKVLMSVGVPEDKIILESQAFTTSENFWFALRWLPKGTGKFYIISSEFHVPRATFTAKAVFNHYYKIIEEEYKDNPRWLSPTKRHPRMEVIQAPVKSFCGSKASLANDADPKGDINSKSLAYRAGRELMISNQQPDSLYGQPHAKYSFNWHAVWAVQINITKDNPENQENWEFGMAQSMNVMNALCVCKAPPEEEGPEIEYPLAFPIDGGFPKDRTPADWKEVQDACGA